MDQEQLTKFSEDPTGCIKAFLENLVEQSPENRLYLIDDRPIFEAPLVGFADGDDPLFAEYKERIIGTFHMTPREVLQRSLSAAGDTTLEETGGVSVICWALPLTKRTKTSNATKEIWPSLRWAHTRCYGEQFNEILRRELVSMLTRLGHFAVAPTLSPAWSRLHRYPGGPVSTWSERHALYAAGLGTFGLCDGFITPKGKAIRCGTVVVNTALPATKRPYESHNDNCTYFTDGSCGLCIDRCPAGAITGRGHSRSTCFGYMRDQIGHIKARYNADPTGCGLCQTKVPCSSRIPADARGSQFGPHL